MERMVTMSRSISFLVFLIFYISILISLNAATPVRIKDITTVSGIRENMLMGMGIVTGLGGKGDSKSFGMTQKMFQNLIANYGFDIDLNDLKSKNIAGVVVTARVNGFARNGEIIDVTVSSIGDAKSLDGGFLLMTPLRAANGTVYAVAQGRVLVGSKETKIETTGTAPASAIIEKDIVSNFIDDRKLNIVLKHPDFVTANQIVEQIKTINEQLQVRAVDAGLVEVVLTEQEALNPIDFISKYEVLTITPDKRAIVIIDKKTGIIVSGGDIVIQPCAISIPGVQIKVGNKANQPKNNIEISSTTVADFVRSLNSAGLDTGSVISLIEAVHRMGALNAALIVL